MAEQVLDVGPLRTNAIGGDYLETQTTGRTALLVEVRLGATTILPNSIVHHTLSQDQANE